MTGTITQVACIGAGLIGAGWAAHFLRAGLDVVAVDPDPSREAHLRRVVAAAWPSLEALGLAGGAAQDRLRFTSSLEEGLAGAQFVQESAIEREDAKVALLARIDGLVPPGVVIASSSSGFLGRVLRSACTASPGRVIVGHPFNPPYLVPLVEIAGGEGADPAAMEAARGFYAATGMTVVTLETEIRGYIANRLQSAVFREVLWMLSQGVASVADIDRAMQAGPAARWSFMGPSAVYFLGAGSPAGHRAFVELLAGELAQGYTAPPGFQPDDALTGRYVEEVAAMMGDAGFAALTRFRDRGLIAIRNAVAGLGDRP